MVQPSGFGRHCHSSPSFGPLHTTDEPRTGVGSRRPTSLLVFGPWRNPRGIRARLTCSPTGGLLGGTPLPLMPQIGLPRWRSLRPPTRRKRPTRSRLPRPLRWKRSIEHRSPRIGLDLPLSRQVRQPTSRSPLPRATGFAPAKMCKTRKRQRQKRRSDTAARPRRDSHAAAQARSTVARPRRGQPSPGSCHPTSSGRAGPPSRRGDRRMRRSCLATLGSGSASGRSS